MRSVLSLHIILLRHGITRSRDLIGRKSTGSRRYCYESDQHLVVGNRQLGTDERRATSHPLRPCGPFKELAAVQLWAAAGKLATLFFFPNAFSALD